jgi:hypothetical protein
MDHFHGSRAVIDGLSRRVLLASIAVVNWVRPGSKTVDYQVALSYSGFSVERKTQLPVNMPKNSLLTCPSYPENSSTTAFALKYKKQRRYTFLHEPIDVVQMENLIQTEDQDHPYRLVGKCVTNGCFHWTGVSCQLGEAVASVKIRKKNDSHCAIRASCRWYAENSFDACSSCSYIRYSTLLSSANTGSAN